MTEQSRLIPTEQQAALASRFKRLHSAADNPFGTLLIVNVFRADNVKTVLEADARALPTSRRLQAIATASFGVAVEAGTDDDHLTWQQNVQASVAIGRAVHAATSAAAPLPFSVDMQEGYGTQLESVLRTLILEAGAVGANIEDAIRPDERGGDGAPLMSVDDAASQVQRAVALASSLGVPDFVVNARTDALLFGGTVDDVIVRAKRYLDAGATTVFVWGSKRGVARDEVAALSRALQGRVSVKLAEDGLTLAQLTELGVARASLGPTLMWKERKGGQALLQKTVQELLEHGKLSSSA